MVLNWYTQIICPPHQVISWQMQVQVVTAFWFYLNMSIMSINKTIIDTEEYGKAQ